MSFLRKHFLFLFFLSCILCSCKANPLSGDRGKAAPAEDTAREGRRDSPALPKIPRLEREDGSPATADTTITEEASIATDVTGAYLRLPKGLVELGSAYSVQSPRSQSQEEWQRYRLTLPARDPEDPQLVVIYRVYRENKVYYGLIPKTELKLDSGGVSFRMEGPGVYQSARTPVLVQKIPEVLIAENGIWNPLAVTQIATIGQPFDFQILDGSLFIASGSQIEYSPIGSTSSVSLTQGTGFRRLAIANFKPFVPQQGNGLGYFVNFTAIGEEYRGDFRPLPINNAGAFELASLKVNDPYLIVLEDMIEVGFSGRISFWDVSGPGPSALQAFPIRAIGNQNLSPNGSNGSVRIGEFVVRPTRMYAILRDGLHSLQLEVPRTITQDSVLENGLNQPFCVAPASQDTLIFVCHDTQKILAINTTDNSKSVSRGELDIGEALFGAVVRDTLLYALARSGRLYIYDIADLNKVVRVGTQDLGLSKGNVTRFKLIGERLYIGYEGNTIAILDL